MYVYIYIYIYAHKYICIYVDMYECTVAILAEDTVPTFLSSDSASCSSKPVELIITLYSCNSSMVGPGVSIVPGIAGVPSMPNLLNTTTTSGFTHQGRMLLPSSRASAAPWQYDEH